MKLLNTQNIVRVYAVACAAGYLFVIWSNLS